MMGFVLTEYQSACRAAHEQAQLLEYLYDRLGENSAWREGAEFQPRARARELEGFRELLHRALQKEDLLPTQPDPEREELLELLAELRDAFAAKDHAAATERLVSEEYGLLRLAEQMQRHARSDAVAEELARTRAAITRLERRRAEPE